jgi:S-adenosylmethionine uptake transporter
MIVTRPAATTAGILLYSLGIFCFAVNDALGKWLITDYSAGQLMALRAVGASAVLAVIVWRRGASLRIEGQYGLHVLRILCSAGDTFAFYFATRALPLADVMTFYMAGPLIIVALSAPVLGERVGLVRWLAVGIGFLGVVVALRPGQGIVAPSALIAIGGAGLFALSITITRKLRATNWLTLTTYQVVGTGIAGALTAGWGWVMPSATDLGLMFAVGIISMGCFMGLTKALALAPASLLAPFQYASIVWAVLMGWAVWGDIPGTATLTGVAVIIASGFFALRSKTTARPA